MIITTLGTSHGNPTYCRYNSATLLETEGNSYLIDVGEPAVASMIRHGKNLDSLKAVFISHMHNDHVNGLPSLIKMLRKYPKEGKHTTTFLPEARYDALGAWLNATNVGWPLPMITAEVTRPGWIYNDGTVQVAAEGTRHLAHFQDPNLPGSYAYVFHAEGKRIVHTGDLSGDFSDFPKAAMDEPCDACICEITHFSPKIAMPVLMESPIKKLILNHVHDPWHGEGEKDLETILSALPYKWHIANDGDQFQA